MNLGEKMENKILLGIIPLILLTSTIPAITVKAFSWNLGAPGTYPTSITVGSSAIVSGTITVDQPTDLHISFKAQYSAAHGNYWTGNWMYEERIITYSAAGTYTVSESFIIPYDLYVESLAGSGTTYRFLAQHYYFYVWAAPKGGSWNDRFGDNEGPHYNPGTGGTSTSTVHYPTVDYHKLLATGIRMIKDKIVPPPGQPDTFTGNEGLRKSLVKKLDEAKDDLDKAYATDKMKSLNAANGKMEAFIKELQTKKAGSWIKAGECIDLAGYIVGWLRNAM